ncbi:MAG: twin-arginine translocase subunit TatC, partial [Alphaproteobacteria bacterium]|nr:twin-arginine translocase subunit TatC [Alphaproteobacteria bacterium]
GLALPIIFLYEISIISARMVEKSRVASGAIDDPDEWEDDDDDEVDGDAAATSTDESDEDKPS